MNFLLLACAKPFIPLIGMAVYSFAPAPLPFPQPAGAAQGPAQGAALPPNGEWPTAVPIPDKDGFCFNPFTQTEVDVRGIPARSLVRDPQDPDPNHKFRVPKFPAP